ncbi:MAG: YdcF family protein [Cyanobacteria bacterium J06626_26]
MTNLWRQWLLRSAIALPTISLFIVLSIKGKLLITTYQTPDPEAILVLGGGTTREPVAAQLAAQNPDLQVWVSSGLMPAQANQLFLAQNVSLNRVNLDYRATDTVTNFTTLVNQLQANNIRHIYLVTSDFHMQRSKAIAFWVLGSRGIAYTPVTVPSNQAPEPHHKIWRDVGRSLLWILTGRTGSSLDPNPPARFS